MLSLIFGFFSAFLPDVIKLFQQKQEFAHDEKMRDKDIEAAKFTKVADLEQSVATGDVQDAISARQAAPPSYGAQLLDALAGEQGWFLRVIKGLLIWALSCIEVLNGLMRPVVVFYVVGLWGAVKGARFYLYYVASTAAGSHIDWSVLAQATTVMWDAEDAVIVECIIGFLFGIRHRLKTLNA